MCTMRSARCLITFKISARHSCSDDSVVATQLVVADSYEHTVSVLHQTGLVNVAVLNADKFRKI